MQTSLMARSLSLAGSLLAAAGASACCLLPLLLALLGMGGAAFAVALEPYRPFFMVMALLFLGGAIYLSRRNPGPARIRPQEVAGPGSSGGRSRVWLWVFVAIVLAVLALPYYVGLFY